MKNLTSTQLRKSFIDFFIGKKHKFVPSSAVVPQDDPTLLFANAGMNQFKDIFLGLKRPAYTRAVNSQKCIRAGGKHNDLEDVGKDGYHHTFFEMLGNWSFGDYYKKEAIQWAWEFLTVVLELPKDKLYATVHKSDQEAFDLWAEHTDIARDHIEFHGDKDNFWEMGATGPCGPCSEIHIDLGTSQCNLQGQAGHTCRVNGDCHRFVELWNLVFIQYQRLEDCSLVDLENTYVDTGAGLERIARVIQGVDSNYGTDLFVPIIGAVRKLATTEDTVAFRVIADHIRALSFALADGGVPSNEGRGYVLRRILRRACRFGRVIGLQEPFLYKLVDVVARVMGEHFGELLAKKDYIKMIIKSEEERFNKTLDKGLLKFAEVTASGQSISGADAFLLYDTFGFPLDLTQLMAAEQGISVDTAGFAKNMSQQKQRARDAAKFEQGAMTTSTQMQELAPTQFVGYDATTTQAKVLFVGQDQSKGQFVVLDKTPFYATSGGQIGDTGQIVASDWSLSVSDVSKSGNLSLHWGEVTGQAPQVGQQVTASVDQQRRANISVHHTATHILQAVLKKQLGEFVQQKGSLVTPKGLRFDFICMDKISPEQLANIEQELNEIARGCYPVLTKQMSLADAKKSGALALFGENYGQKVRVVSVGDVSMELCGGTHLTNSGEIGLFKIVSESSVSAGVRRIFAVCGQEALQYCVGKEQELLELSAKLGAPLDKLSAKVDTVCQERKALLKEVEQLKGQIASAALDNILKKRKTINNVAVAMGALPAGADLKSSVPMLQDKLGDGLVVLVLPSTDSFTLGVGVSPNLQSKWKAGLLVKELTSAFGGKGGGRPQAAFGAGSLPEEGTQQVIRVLQQKLEQTLTEMSH